MKKNIIISSIVITLGLLVSLGPQFVFKVCEGGCCGNLCNISAAAEVGVGLFIVALGACMLVYTDPKTQLGFVIGLFMASIVALAIPHFLIGGCAGLEMNCRRVAFPALTVESVTLMILSSVLAAIILMRKPTA
jgi:hypothetical protein